MADRKLSLTTSKGDELFVEAVTEDEEGASYQLAHHSWCRVRYLVKNETIKQQQNCTKDLFPAIKNIAVRPKAAAKTDAGKWLITTQATTGGWRLLLLSPDRSEIEQERKVSTEEELPSAMVKFGANRVLAFFQHITGVFDSNNVNSMVVSQKTNFMSTSTWLGCPPRFCFDANVDAVLATTKTYRLFRGHYAWDVRRGNGSSGTIGEAVQLSEQLEHVDAAVSYNGRDYHFKGNTIYIKKEGKTLDQDLLHTTFPCMSPPVDAALKFEDRVALIRGYTYWLFDKATDIDFTWNRSGSVSDMVGGKAVPRDLDAALSHKDGDKNVVLFFKRHHVFEVRNDSAVNVRLIAQLVGCSDQFYATSCPECKQLRIKSAEDFVKYRNQFKPSNSQSSDKAQTDCPAHIQPGTRHQKGSGTSRRRHVEIAALVVALIAFFSVVALILYYCLKKRSQHKGSASKQDGSAPGKTASCKSLPSTSPQTPASTQPLPPPKPPRSPSKQQETPNAGSAPSPSTSASSEEQTSSSLK